MILRWIRAFGLFWWDFLVGDTPEVLVGVLVVIAVVALVRHDSVVAFVTLPLLVTAVLVGSVMRGRARA